MAPKWTKMTRNDPFWTMIAHFDSKMFLNRKIFASPARSDWCKSILIQKTIVEPGTVFASPEKYFD